MMALDTKSYSAVTINTSELELGDILVVQFETGQTVILLPSREASGELRWLYAGKSWLRKDQRTIEHLIERNRGIKAFDGFGNIHNGSVSAFTRARQQFRLHEPLQLEIEIRWQSDSKGRERSRTLGTMTSAGGLVMRVAAARLPSLARS